MTEELSTSPHSPATQERKYELSLERVFDAPVAWVYRIWEDREHMVHWWGPKDFTCTSVDFELVPGRAWRACIVSEKYGKSWMGGVVREVEKERRIVFTFSWEDSRDGEGVDTVVTVTFSEHDGKTKQTFHQAPFRTLDGRDSHVGGWSEFLDRMQAHAYSRWENHAR